MKIQLIRPPLDDWYTIPQLEDNTSHPIGLAILASAIRKKIPGADIQIIDGNRRSLDYVLSKLGDADFVGVTSMFSHYDNACKILESAKNHGAQTIIGGANVTHLAPRILTNRPFIDFAVINDGEEALPEIVLGKAGQFTPNLVYRKDGQIVESLVKRNAPMDTLFDLEDITDRDSWNPQSIPVSGIRGCMKAELNDLCDFCSIDHKLKVMKPEVMWDQIRILKGYGFNYFWEAGETVFPGYLNALLKARPADLADVQWKFYICADIVTSEVADTLSRLGTREVMIGLETPNDAILKKVGKKASSVDNQRAIGILSHYGINIHLGVMYGLTGETPETAQQTFDYVSSLVAQHSNIVKFVTSHAVPFFNTGMFKRLIKSPEAKREYAGNLDTDDTFDYHALARIYTKHFTTVDFDAMDQLVGKTRDLMKGRGYGSSFYISPKK